MTALELKPCWGLQPDRGLGISKPHITFGRYFDGSQMVKVDYWPMWPVDAGWSHAAGEDLEEAWEAHMQCYEEDDEELS